ncbi:MAG: hypothetical protein AAGA68_07230 [Pseudomonadota bacterium]
MTTYKIIDEPKARRGMESLIVDPTVILLASMIIPLFWLPPAGGRYWLPMLWLALNGYALGSPTLGKEILTMLLGALGVVGLLFIVLALIQAGVLPFTEEGAYPYLRILTFGLFFLAVYMVVFRQATSYALFQYIQGDRR